MRVFGSFLILFFVYGIWQSGSVLLPAIVSQEDWGIGRTSLVFSVAFVAYGLASPLVGWSVDRFGAFPVFRVGTVLTVLGLIASGLTRGPVQLMATYGFLVASGIAAVGVIPQAVYIRASEPKAPGRALGVAQSGLGLGPMIIIPATAALATAVGWRLTTVSLGVVAALVVPLGLWLLLTADRRATEGRPDLRRGGLGDFRILLSDIRTWQLVGGVMLVTSACMSVVLHQVVYLTDGGFSIGSGSLAAGGTALVSAFARPLWGSVTDRFSRRISFAWLAGLGTVGILLLRLASQRSSGLAALGYVVVFGAGYGGVSPLFPVVAEDLHGRERLGTTFGLMGVGIGLGAGVGSSAIGVLRDRLGSYDSIILVPILSLVAGVAVMASVTRGRGTS